MNSPHFRMVEKLDEVMNKLETQEKEIENVKSSMKDIKARI